MDVPEWLEEEFVWMAANGMNPKLLTHNGQVMGLISDRVDDANADQ